MKKQIELTRTAFINICKNDRQNSCVVNLGFTENLHVNNLPPEAKLNIIGKNIQQNDDEIDQLNRELYIQFRNDDERLYALFKGTGRLNNPEELNKLQHAIILGDRKELLVNMVTDIEQKERTMDYCIVHTSQQVHDSLPAGQCVDLPPLTARRMKEEMDGRKDKGEIIRRITIMLMQRFNFLIHAADVDLFVQFILDPTIQCTGTTIALGCKTIEFKYIIYRFKGFTKGLRYVNVGRSGLFISKGKHLIKDHNLGSSSYKNLNTRHGIDNVFAEFEM